MDGTFAHLRVLLVQYECMQLKAPMSDVFGLRVNPLEALYPMLQPSRFFARVLGVGFCPAARRTLIASEYVEGAPLAHCPVPTLHNASSQPSLASRSRCEQ